MYTSMRKYSCRRYEADFIGIDLHAVPSSQGEALFCGEHALSFLVSLLIMLVSPGCVLIGTSHWVLKDCPPRSVVTLNKPVSRSILIGRLDSGFLARDRIGNCSCHGGVTGPCLMFT